jgi:KipI family sensor histidine kinase inhibitor
MRARFLPSGPTAVVIEVDGIDAAIELGSWLRTHRPPGIIDLVPAATTLLVTASGPSKLIGLEELVDAYETGGADRMEGVLITIETVYDGEDLEDVGSQSRLSVDDVIDLHSSATYVAAFCGFAPGFAYLTGLDPRLQLPRRPTPRPRVPAGSVAMATQFTGVYPTASPGGWNLLGHTEAVPWDVGRDKPALIEPGDRVRFVPVRR